MGVSDDTLSEMELALGREVEDALDRVWRQNSFLVQVDDPIVIVEYVHRWLKIEETSDAGSQYRCGRVGMVGASNPKPHPVPLPPHTRRHTQSASKTLVFPLFDLF